MNPLEYDDLMTPAEVGRVFRVDARTVTRWARSGKLRAIKTPGGTRRFRAIDVAAALKAGTSTGQATQ